MDMKSIMSFAKSIELIQHFIDIRSLRVTEKILLNEIKNIQFNSTQFIDSQQRK